MIVDDTLLKPTCHCEANSGDKNKKPGQNPHPDAQSVSECRQNLARQWQTGPQWLRPRRYFSWHSREL